MDLIKNVSNKIRILPSIVANQIAAGEVIERPASIIKELLENSLDAGSDNIIVTIRQAGNSLIRITDNGCGILKDDLRYAICQHATSKLYTLADLDSIASLGFRGEALASICAVARCKITSRARAKDNQQAWSLEVEEDQENYKILPAAHPYGTTIEVSDLFYSLPVRKRFLKSEKTEYQQIIDIFQKIALSNFACAFTLINENKVVYKLLKAENQSARIQRVKKIFGGLFVENSIYFEGEAQGLALSGWVGGRNNHRSQADQQYFFLNNRVIRDKLILHAIKVAYADLIPDGRHPSYTLYLTIDPSEIDVNVHPTKHEVRFMNSRWVHQFIVQQLNKVLSEESQEGILLQDSNTLIPAEISSMKSWDLRLNKPVTQTFPGYSLRLSRDDKTKQKSCQSLNNIKTNFSQFNYNLLHTESLEKPIENLGTIIADFSDYILITKNSHNDQYYLIDLHAAYNYLAYKKLEQSWQSAETLSASSMLMLSEQILLSDLFASIFLINDKFKYINNLNQDLFLEKIHHVLCNIKSFGFDFIVNYAENISDNTNLVYTIQTTGEVVNRIIITAVPKIFRYAKLSELLSVFILSMLDINNYTQTKLADLLFSSVNLLGRLSDNLLLTEQQAILDKLAKVGYNGLTFMGRKVVKALSTNDLEKLLI